MGREHETRHSELSAYLHVVAGDGGATEYLDVYDRGYRRRQPNRCLRTASARKS
jgi:hypothetical protein